MDWPGPPQAVILAAGYGRRMQPLSDSCHKALLSIDGVTILGRIMEGLTRIGVDRVTVVTGYRSEDVTKFLASGYPDIDLRVVHNDRFRETNNVVSLSMAFDEMSFDRDVILVECDLLFDPSIMDRLMANTGQNVALVDRYRTGMDGTVVEIHDGLVTGVFPPEAQGADFTYDGKFKTLNIYRFGRDFCERAFRPLLHTYANAIDSSSYYELVLGMLNNIRAHRVSAEVVEGERWAEVDDPNDLAVATFQFTPDQRTAILDRAFGGHWNFEVMDFSLMRNAYFPTGAMMATFRHALPSLITSYGSAQPVLNEKLSYFLQCSSDHVQVLHGASQAFPIMARLFEGSTVLMPSATFGEYGRTFPAGDLYEDRPGIEWSDIESGAADHDVVVIVNPNTSTGTTLPSASIIEMARRRPETTFWVDESFLPFSGEPSLVETLKSEAIENVVVLMSLSKSLGVPGLRMGYVYSRDRALIEAFGSALPVWNLSSPAEFMLELILKFRPAYESSLRQTAEDRESLRAALEGIPFVASVPASGGNFLAVELLGLPSAAADLRRTLLADYAIEVKDITGKFADARPRVRVAVRTKDENGELIAALTRLRGSGGAP